MHTKTSAEDPMFTIYTLVFVILGVISFIIAFTLIKTTGTWFLEQHRQYHEFTQK